MNLKVISVDPGVTTGIAIHGVYEDRVNNDWERLELGPDKHHLDLWGLLVHHQPDTLVCERFEYRNITHKGTEMPGVKLESREYIGVCELYTQMYPRCILVMSPTNNKGKKALMSPDKLKALGLYQAPGGRQHMNDATAHLLHYIVTKLGRRDYLTGLHRQ